MRAMCMVVCCYSSSSSPSVYVQLRRIEMCENGVGTGTSNIIGLLERLDVDRVEQTTTARRNEGQQLDRPLTYSHLPSMAIASSW